MDAAGEGAGRARGGAALCRRRGSGGARRLASPDGHDHDEYNHDEHNHDDEYPDDDVELDDDHHDDPEHGSDDHDLARADDHDNRPVDNDDQFFPAAAAAEDSPGSARA